MEIRKATENDQAAWDAYVLAHAEGLAYHRFAWKKCVAEAYHFDAAYLIAESAGEICGVLPLIDFKRPFLGHIYLSLPYCDQAACLVDDPQVERLLLRKAEEMAMRAGVETIELRQKSPHSATHPQSLPAKKVRMVLELPDSSSLLRQGMKAKLRSQIRKPERDGLTACLGGLELLDSFYTIFSQNMRNLGSPVHSRKWFEAVVRNYSPNVRVGLAFTPDGRPAAGGILLLHGRTASVPWASSLHAYRSLNPNMLLYWIFLAFTADNHFALFDFGRSTPGDGTYRFKEQWGARPVELLWRTYDCKGAVKLSRSANHGLRHWAEKVWMRMPLGFCNRFGPVVRRYVSL